ncbi:MAG: Clostripain family protein, partial [Bacteroidales bacterium]|nr:Clostripain family protein [Bacteroidales bacterium]
MKKAVILMFIYSLLTVSCTKDDEPEPQETERTVFMYLPWSTNLAAHFAKNLTDLETALQDNILKNNRLLVFLSTSSTEAIMFEMEYKDGKNTRTTLKEYTNPAFTTSTGITSILNDVRYFAPANRYAMIIGSHGMAWLPVQQEQSTLKLGREKDYWEYEGVPETRFFGGTTPEYQTDITTLASGIAGAGIKMDYILFDDCYMSSIEVAYELKDVTDYLIASPTEVMVYGFPYHTIGRYLVGNVDLLGICNGFYDFYKDYQYPYGTIGVTVCAELDALAAVMKEMNSRFSFDPALLSEVQRMDGY